MRISQNDSIDPDRREVLGQNGLYIHQHSREFQDFFSFLSVLLFDSDCYKNQLQNVIRNIQGKVLRFNFLNKNFLRRPVNSGFLNHHFLLWKCK